MILVNKQGYLVRHMSGNEWRTYCCSDVGALAHLVMKLTGRELSTFPVDASNNLYTKELNIQSGLHIYFSTTRQGE